jgi:DnaJ-class molecular chaperone
MSLRVKIEVVETTLRTYEMEGVTEDQAREIVSNMYQDFAEKGESPENGKDTGFCFQIRSLTQLPPTLKWQTCESCEGEGGFPYYMKLDKKVSYMMSCCECSGKGVVPSPGDS